MLCNSFWVAEKSDGVRVLLFVYTDVNSMDQTVFIVSAQAALGGLVVLNVTVCSPLQIDRHNSYREIHGLYFPNFEDPRKPLRSSIVDGELVIDVDPRTKQVCGVHSTESLTHAHILILGDVAIPRVRLSGCQRPKRDGPNAGQAIRGPFAILRHIRSWCRSCGHFAASQGMDVQAVSKNATRPSTYGNVPTIRVSQRQ